MASVDNRVFDRLRQDSEDINVALDQFMKERELALATQLNAKRDYDNDMKCLDEADININFEKAMRTTVDHNLLRHLNVAVEGNENSFEIDENDYEQEEDMIAQEEQYTPLPTTGGSVILKEKKPIPSFEEKIEIREKMFAFLDESRLRELQLVCNIFRLVYYDF